MIYLNTLHEGDTITETYFCKDKTVAQSKAGKTYYSLKLQDKTGVIDAKVWDLTNAIEHFEPKDFIRITGQVTSFNNALQLNVKQARRAAEGTYEVSDYMPVSPYNIEDMYAELLQLIDTINEPHLKALLEEFFVKDTAFIKEFKKTSAAKFMHHAFIGGLLQHTLSVAKISDFIAGHYALINRDLLITAAICHDIGKVKEIVTNLVQNAVKFTAAGSITIGFDLPQSDKFTLWVLDTGKGVAQEDQQRIFERFVKVDEYIPGTGLGLSVAKSHAESLGGSIGVDSILGEGSRFWVELPLR
jgi:23S rRNA maturation-related 3'-5' exoribonuclease YhaM